MSDYDTAEPWIPVPDEPYAQPRPWLCPEGDGTILQEVRPSDDGRAWIGWCPEHGTVLGVQRSVDGIVSQEPENDPEEEIE